MMDNKPKDGDDWGTWYHRWLELVRQTLAQGLACPGVVREAKIAANLETENNVGNNQRGLLELTTCFRSLWLGSLLSWITIFPRIIAT